MTTEEFLKNGKWFISRNYSLMVWDEYVADNSWQGYRKLNDVIKYQIYISGVHKSDSFGCKPKRWHSELLFNNGDLKYRIKSTHPSCKSIRDACYQADRFLTLKEFENACGFFTSQQKATCVVNENLEPYFTAFGSPQWMSYYDGSRYVRNYKTGKYHTARMNWDKKIKYSTYKLFFGGYVGGSKEVEFEHWL